MAENAATIVEGLYAAYQKGDLETVYRGLSPQVRWRVVGRTEQLPVFGEWGERGGPQAFFSSVADTLEFEDFKVDGVYGAGEKVFVLGRYAVAMKNTGKRAESDFVHVLTVKGGAVTEFHEFLDTAAMVQAYQA